MEQKRFSPLKLVAAIAFALMTLFVIGDSFTMLLGMLSDFSHYTSNFFRFMSALSIILGTTLSVLGYLVVTIACFMRKPRMLAIIGVALLALCAIMSWCGSWVDDLRILFRYGVEPYVETVLTLEYLVHQLYMLLPVISFLVLALVLLINKKGNKILAFIPSVLIFFAPFTYMLYTLIVMIKHNLQFRYFFQGIGNAGFLMMVLQVVGFAMLCLAVPQSMETVQPAAEEVVEAPVVEEAPVQEEIPMAEEAAAE